MKEFPWEYEASKEILFYPLKPDSFGGEVLEVGPGRGDLLLSLAKASPETRFVAIELGKKRYYKLIPRVQKLALENVLLIQGDARIILPRFFPPNTFSKMYVLFPDPWPKRRHVPKRLLTAEFLRLLARFLRVGGDLFMATDVTFYALWVVENAAQVAGLANQGAPFVESRRLADYEPTFFEMKWRAAGRAIHYLWYRKTAIDSKM